MKDIVLISIPETTIKNIVESAVKKAMAEYGTAKNPNPVNKVLNFTEGCKYVGISKSHGYKLTSQKRIPHFKKGKRIYFKKSELDKYLLSNKVSTIDEMMEETDQYLQNKKGR